MVRVGGRGVVLERLVVGDVVVLVAEVAGVPPRADADRVDGVAQRLVGCVRRHDLAGEDAAELVRRERAGRLDGAAVTRPSAVANEVVGRKPPWNQPQERPAALSSSPMFWPFSATASRVEQSSQ